jgi:hypothetical protein
MPLPTVPDTPQLPNPSRLNDSYAIAAWASDLSRVLIELLARVCYRVNRVVVPDGTIAMTGPLKLATYATADLPDATEWEGGAVYVSDASAGSKLQYSDGTNWVAAG